MLYVPLCALISRQGAFFCCFKQADRIYTIMLEVAHRWKLKVLPVLSFRARQLWHSWQNTYWPLPLSPPSLLFLPLPTYSSSLLLLPLQHTSLNNVI